MELAIIIIVAIYVFYTIYTKNIKDASRSTIDVKEDQEPEMVKDDQGADDTPETNEEQNVVEAEGNEK